MKRIIAGAVLAALISTTALAQADPTMSTAEMQSVPNTVSQQSLVLKSGTPITLVVTEEANSSTHREGDVIKLTVLNDVSIGQTVVIPRGTPATGEITWRTGKGAFGKSGKMEFSLRSINLNGKLIPITGDYRQEGEGNTVATGVGVIAIGVFAGFITGKRARVPVGRELLSQLAQDVPFDAGGSLAASFDSSAAVKTAELATPLGKCKADATKISNEKKRKSALEDCYAKRME